ncbi:MAG: GDP-mannose 4,6-dehydratase [Bryobacterales bacterium]|nr:GDP-mannose 4,6-dehydratase [Bryobacteraceae bacterium]MDW8355907.1 GDP-mannose 4,6-dehydratase [Bryobacterales bacterium]
MSKAREGGQRSEEPVLITGGAGFIGSNLADCYLSQGRNVVILDNFSRRGSEDNAAWLLSRYGGKLKVMRADVRAEGAWQDEIAQAGVVFHLAAQVAVTTSVADPRTDFEINARGTLNVLEAARAARSKPVVIYSSTNKVYGSLEACRVVAEASRYVLADLPEGIPETYPLDFQSPYGCSKGAADQYVLDYGRVYGLKTVVFRQSCIYGPRQFGLEDQGWVAWFALRALAGLPITIYGDGKQVRDVLYVDDLLAAFEAAVRRADDVAAQAFNIGGGPENTLSLRELIAMLEAELGRPVPHSFERWRPADQRVFVSDIRKASALLGWRPRVSVQDGIRRLLRWLKDHWELVMPEGTQPRAPLPGGACR